MWHVPGIDYLQKSAVLKESDLIKGLLMRFTGAVEAECLCILFTRDIRFF